MIELRDKETGARVGEITEEQLRFLTDQLEEESSDDRDYYINGATLDLFAGKGADPQLLALLRGALGEREGVELVWSRGAE